MDAHDSEYKAAVSGMADTYGRSPSLPAVGDWVNGTSAGKRWSGRVLEVDEKRLAVDCEGAWIVVPTSDMDRF